MPRLLNFSLVCSLFKSQAIFFDKEFFSSSKQIYLLGVRSYWQTIVPSFYIPQCTPTATPVIVVSLHKNSHTRIMFKMKFDSVDANYIPFKCVK